MGHSLHSTIPAAQVISVTASDAKKDFGKILERAIKGEVVTITKHDAPKAVLISVERFEQLAHPAEQQIDTLDAKFDAMLKRMQTSTQRSGVRAAFAASPKDLGKAALEAARPRNRG